MLDLFRIASGSASVARKGLRSKQLEILVGIEQNGFSAWQLHKQFTCAVKCADNFACVDGREGKSERQQFQRSRVSSRRVATATTAAL